MPNDFEKQVKQKMEELTFVPQPPVWNNIEKQIRQKDKRRRMIIWLPLMLLMIGGGVVLLSRNPITNHLEGKSDVPKSSYQNHAPANEDNSETAPEQNNITNHTNDQEISSEKKEDVPEQNNRISGKINNRET